jgi:hypothetical protein
MCEIRSREKMAKNKNKKIKCSGQQQKEIDYGEPHLASNEKTQPIQSRELVH